MGKARWVGDDLWRLLNLSLSELIALYPQYTEATLKGKRAYWRKKITLGEIDMPPKPEQPTVENFGDILRLHNLSPELAREFTDQGYHVGFIRNKEGEIEYTIPLPHARTGKANLDDFAPATPAKITPSKRKPVVRDHKVIYAFSDAQIDYRRLEDGSLLPIHDERALKVSRLICQDLQPDVIINLGDTVDLSALGRFQPDSDHFQRTLGPSFQRAHDMYAELRADNPTAEIVEVDSNHNTRIKRFVMKYAPALYGLKRAKAEDREYPVMSYPFLTNLGHLGVKWVSGYEAAEFVYGDDYYDENGKKKPPIIFKHGFSSVSRGSTAAQESSRNPETHVVRGHSHRIELAYRTTRAGHYLATAICGVLCKINGEVPSVHSAVDDYNQVVPYQENWQQGALVIEDYQGDYVFTQIPIRNGTAYFRGKEYHGD